ncbi:hypothetical protein D3C86_1302130 [compost metagenome]
MITWILRRKSSNRRDNLDPIRRLGIRTKEIVFGQLLHHSLPAEQQCERIDYSGFPGIISAYPHGVLLEVNNPLANTSEILNFKDSNSHPSSLSLALVVMQHTFLTPSLKAMVST